MKNRPPKEVQRLMSKVRVYGMEVTPYEVLDYLSDTAEKRKLDAIQYSHVLLNNPSGVEMKMMMAHFTKASKERS